LPHFIDKMSEIKDKILTEAELLFMRYGFKSITMDDVARELGVSKKTLYQFFSDKNDLVNQCVEHYLETMNTMCCSVVENKDLDAISVMLQISEQMNAMIRQINPSSMFDLKKYFKPAWDKLEADRRSFIKRVIQDNILLGVKKGLYRKDLDAETVSRIYIYLVGFLTNPDNYDQEGMDIKEMHLEIVKYHLRSISTAKGHELLDEKLLATRNK
jgi:AcrR family transcriptional regulator